jgi:hypothetical protein
MTAKIKIGYVENESGVALVAEMVNGSNAIEVAWSRKAMTYVHQIIGRQDLDSLKVPSNLASVAEIIIASDEDCDGDMICVDILTSKDIEISEVANRRYTVGLKLDIGGAKGRLGGMLEPHVVVATIANNMLVEAITAVSLP